MKRAIIVAVGYLARDIVYAVEEFPAVAGEAYARHFLETFGGSCGNVSTYATVTFDVPTAVVAAVGNDRVGHWLVNHLRKDGIDTTHVKRREGETATITLVTNAKRERIFYTSPGTIQPLQREDLPVDCIKQATFVYIAPCHVGLIKMAHALAVQLGKRVVLNPGTVLNDSTDLSEFLALLPDTDFLFLNRDEAIKYSSLETVQDVIQFYVDQGVRTLIVTDAENGSIVATQDEMFFQPAYCVDVVDPLGPGDAYAGGFLTALFQTGDLSKAALAGTQIGAYVVTQWGVRQSVPNRAQLAAFISRLSFYKYGSEAVSCTAWPQVID